MSEFNIVGGLIDNTFSTFRGLLYNLAKQMIDDQTVRTFDYLINGIVSILEDDDFNALLNKIENNSSNYNLIALKNFLDLLIESKKKLGNPANKIRYDLLIETIENILISPPPAREGVYNNYNLKFLN